LLPYKHVGRNFASVQEQDSLLILFSFSQEGSVQQWETKINAMLFDNMYM